jgi:hypothetical protein
MSSAQENNGQLPRKNEYDVVIIQKLLGVEHNRIGRKTEGRGKEDG